MKAVVEGDSIATADNIPWRYGIQCEAELEKYICYTKRGSTHVIDLLIEPAPTEERRKEAADTALWHAASHGDVKIVRHLLANKAGNPSRALRAAAYKGDIEIVKLLLDAGADVHYGQDEALAMAASQAHAEMVRLLLRRGADATAAPDKETILSYALTPHLLGVPYADFWKAKKVIIELLLQHGADPNRHSENYEGEDDGTALHTLCKMWPRWTPPADKERIAKRLLKAGVDINARNGKGSTALMVAVTRHDAAMVKLLIQAGADINARNKKGVTALMLAKAVTDIYHEGEILDLLRAAGAVDRKGKKLGNDDIDA